MSQSENRCKNNKKSVYFPDGMMREIERESIRQDRTVSWLLQQAWSLSRFEIKGYPGARKP
jgi:uncharacterized small protein (TIGR04563 family)